VAKAEEKRNPSSDNRQSETTFGASMESKAQIADSAISAGGQLDGPLNIYRLIPIAAASDPRWQAAPSQGEVVVAARTAGDARIVAAGGELDFMDIDAAPAEGVSTASASPFRSEKLYTVVEIERGRTDLARGVLSGTISVANIQPTQK